MTRDWMADAACRGKPFALFFPPELTRGQTLAQHWSPDAALAICGSCDVVAECSAYATRIDACWGVWAGRFIDNEPRTRRGGRPLEERRDNESARVGARREAVAKLDGWSRSCADIAERVGVSRTTVRYDLAAMRREATEAAPGAELEATMRRKRLDNQRQTAEQTHELFGTDEGKAS